MALKSFRVGVKDWLETEKVKFLSLKSNTISGNHPKDPPLTHLVLDTSEVNVVCIGLTQHFLIRLAMVFNPL